MIQIKSDIIQENREYKYLLFRYLDIIVYVIRNILNSLFNKDRDTLYALNNLIYILYLIFK